MKTNKAFSSRYKVTKNKKVLARKIGQNHFNAKESRRKQITEKKKLHNINFSNRNMRRFLPNT